MATLVLSTTSVTYDEPCLGLREVHEQSPGSRGFHRYQEITVMRGDRPAVFRQDLGPASKFKEIQPFQIPGGAMANNGRFHIVHTVGQLIDMADYLREGPHQDIVPEAMTGPEMAASYHRTQDKARASRVGRVSVAPSLILPKR